MKKTLLLSCVILSIQSFSQDSLKIARIDSLVNWCNHANLTVSRDSVINNYPELGMQSRTQLTMLTENGKLRKYANEVTSSRKTGDSTEQMEGGNIFYFQNDHLIKVEEMIKNKMNSVAIQWYFEEDKLISYAVKPEQARPSPEKIKERSEFLVTLAKSLIASTKPPANR